MADPDDCFLSTLEKLALKNSANDEVYNRIKNTFELKLNEPSFIKLNKKKDDNNTEKLDTSIIKLRAKVKNLKTEWKRRQDRIKNGTGESASVEPMWYQILNPVLSETNNPVCSASSAQDTSYVQLEEPNNVFSESEDNNSEVENDIEFDSSMLLKHLPVEGGIDQ